MDDGKNGIYCPCCEPFSFLESKRDEVIENQSFQWVLENFLRRLAKHNGSLIDDKWYRWVCDFNIKNNIVSMRNFQLIQSED